MRENEGTKSKQVSQWLDLRGDLNDRCYGWIPGMVLVSLHFLEEFFGDRKVSVPKFSSDILSSPVRFQYLG